MSKTPISHLAQHRMLFTAKQWNWQCDALWQNLACLAKNSVHLKFCSFLFFKVVLLIFVWDDFSVPGATGHKTSRVLVITWKFIRLPPAVKKAFFGIICRIPNLRFSWVYTRNAEFRQTFTEWMEINLPDEQHLLAVDGTCCHLPMNSPGLLTEPL